MEGTTEEMMEVEKKYQKKKTNSHYRRKFTSVSLARKKKATQDQNILVTATLVKRERPFLKNKL